MCPDLAAFTAAADAAHVYIVKNRAELVAALYGRARAAPSAAAITVV